jgi:hypothetical protein
MKTRDKNFALDQLRKAIDGLGCAFTWSASDEGIDYWQEVMNRLEKYKALAMKEDSCRSEIAELKRRLAELEGRC